MVREAYPRGKEGAGRIAVFGASGFVGSHVVARGRSMGAEIVGIETPRVSCALSESARGAAEWWQRSNLRAFARLCRSLEPFDVVVNAAGLPVPGSTDRTELFTANAVLPAVLASAARAAGVGRFVHVSTAAVQGRLDPLDESPTLCPLSPYAESKAEGERALLEADAERNEAAPEVVVYRPTSIHGRGRAVTNNLARLAALLPFVPVAGHGHRPVPVGLVENVAAGVLFAATAPGPPSIVLQPWEGITVRRLLELFGARRIVPVPARLLDALLTGLARPASRFPSLIARLRRVEVVLRGQGVAGEWLSAAGFRPPLGEEGWVALARAELAGATDDPGKLPVPRAGG